MGDILDGVLVRAPSLMPGSGQCDLKDDDTISYVPILGMDFLFT